MNKTSIAAAAASAVLLAMSGGASAAEATASVNVRSGPGTSYGIVDTLYPGEDVTVTECRTNGWCAVIHTGPDGWVSRNYLSGIGGAAPAPAPQQPNVSVNFGVGGFTFSFGSGGFSLRPNPPPGGLVCFYEHFNFQGSSFCARPGEARRSVGSAWNDRISSIRVTGGAEVQVCEHINYGGRCAVVSNSVFQLPPRGNDMISSFRVR
jgi:uncharacterized protein YraI